MSCVLVDNLQPMRILILAILVASFSVSCSPKPERFSPQMVAAVYQARASLTNFTRALESSKTNGTFCQILVPFRSSSGNVANSVWVNVGSYDGVSFRGIIAAVNPSLHITNNDFVVVPATNILDWAVWSTKGVAVEGRFLDRVRH